MGNRGVIAPGDVQWMTAGSGIIHQEMPKGDADGAHAAASSSGPICPAAHKMMDPRYRGVTGARDPRGDRLTAGPRSRSLRASSGVRARCATSSPTRNISTSRCRPARRFTPPDTARPYGLRLRHRRQGIFCHEKDPFSYEAEGDELLRHGARAPDRRIGTSCSSTTATQVTVTTEDGTGALPADLGKADR